MHKDNSPRGGPGGTAARPAAQGRAHDGDDPVGQAKGDVDHHEWKVVVERAAVVVDAADDRQEGLEDDEDGGEQGRDDAEGEVGGHPAGLCAPGRHEAQGSCQDEKEAAPEALAYQCLGHIFIPFAECFIAKN